jgi:hypothetical protein
VGCVSDLGAEGGWSRERLVDPEVNPVRGSSWEARRADGSSGALDLLFIHGINDYG